MKMRIKKATPATTNGGTGAPEGAGCATKAAAASTTNTPAATASTAVTRINALEPMPPAKHQWRPPVAKPRNMMSLSNYLRAAPRIVHEFVAFCEDPGESEALVIRRIRRCLRTATTSSIKEDKHGNLWVVVGKKKEAARTLFTSHLDTVETGRSRKQRLELFRDPASQRPLLGSDLKGILGADCRAGVVIMLHMIRSGVVGTYGFFSQEEVGCRGSEAASVDMAIRKSKGGIVPDRCVSFDRARFGSVITDQMSGQTCSEAFAIDLALELEKAMDGRGDIPSKWRLDNGGVYTDSNSFANIISECTNLSVGYTGQHTSGETQDVEYLVAVAEAAVQVNWQSLPAERDPRRHGNTRGYSLGYGSYDRYEDPRGYFGGRGYGSTYSHGVDDWTYDEVNGEWALRASTGRHGASSRAGVVLGRHTADAVIETIYTALAADDEAVVELLAANDLLYDLERIIADATSRQEKDDGGVEFEFEDEDEDEDEAAAGWPLTGSW